jgi:hypothetical protein
LSTSHELMYFVPSELSLAELHPRQFGGPPRVWLEKKKLKREKRREKYLRTRPLVERILS